MVRVVSSSQLIERGGGSGEQQKAEFSLRSRRHRSQWGLQVTAGGCYRQAIVYYRRGSEGSGYYRQALVYYRQGSAVVDITDIAV